MWSQLLIQSHVVWENPSQTRISFFTQFITTQNSCPSMVRKDKPEPYLWYENIHRRLHLRPWFGALTIGVLPFLLGELTVYFLGPNLHVPIYVTQNVTFPGGASERDFEFFLLDWAILIIY